LREKISSAPRWDRIFLAKPELEAPGYQETMAYIKSNPRIKPKEIKKEEIKKKKNAKAIGRGKR
jgi:hypothetical protein